MRKRNIIREPMLWIAAAVLVLAAGIVVLNEALREAPEPQAAQPAASQTAIATPAQASVQVTVRQTNYGDEYLVYDLGVPVVSGFADAQFEYSLNERIRKRVKTDQAAALDYALWFAQEVEAGRMLPYDCVFTASCETKCTYGILSLKVATFLDNGGTGMPHTAYYNVDIEACKMLALPDLFTGRAIKAASMPRSMRRCAKPRSVTTCPLRAFRRIRSSTCRAGGSLSRSPNTK
jgi:ferredoxin